MSELCEDLEAWARVSGIAHEDDSVVRSRNGVFRDRNQNVPVGEVETLGERVVDVQTPTLGEEDRADGVRDVHGLLVERPFDVVGLPDAPYGLIGRVEDLGDPDIPGGEVHRCGEGGCGNGEENSSKSGREFHR